MFKLEIKQIRKLRNVTQQELADRIGVSRSYISKIENADYGNIQVGMMQKILLALDVIPQDLFMYCDRCRYKRHYLKNHPK